MSGALKRLQLPLTLRDIQRGALEGIEPHDRVMMHPCWTFMDGESLATLMDQAHVSRLVQIHGPKWEAINRLGWVHEEVTKEPSTREKGEKNHDEEKQGSGSAPEQQTPNRQSGAGSESPTRPAGSGTGESPERDRDSSGVAQGGDAKQGRDANDNPTQAAAPNSSQAGDERSPESAGEHGADELHAEEQATAKLEHGREDAALSGDGIVSTPHSSGETQDADIDPDALGGEEPLGVRRPRLTPGGNFLPESLPRRRDAQLARDARRALKRFVDQECDGGLDTSPRTAHRKLVTELVTRRYALSRCRRSELSRKRVLIAVDVSGSCSATCGEAYYAAQELAAADRRIVLLIHTNGFPVRLCVDRKDIEIEKGEMRDQIEWIDCIIDHLSRLSITTAVVMGDWDAEQMYHCLANDGVRLIWLDSYGKTYGPPRRTRIDVPKSLTGAEYWTRCGTAEEFIKVLHS